MTRVDILNMQKGMADSNVNESMTGLHVVAKPMGPMCNLTCDYCVYVIQLKNGRVAT